MPTRTDAPAAPFKYTVPFTASANAALLAAAQAERMEPTEIIQRATINYLIDAGHMPQEEADRFKLFWWLVDETVLAAQKICRDGGFSRSITLDAIHACMNDPKWIERYRTYVRDDIFKNGNPEKGPINREIGFRIRAGIGGVVEKTPKGKSATVKVLGEIIQSYTPMVDYDRAVFGPSNAA
ncbi:MULTISPECIES: hypothetical protein [unclassified Mesorhizobium]|uniref:hypothetical protein n=1 Tax=unclassified Mesorhizobium TaxID=325217 RepID=UPI00112BFB73|nr:MULTISPECIES: hypothetical protein [unclassified Mesorhizobium]MBZ9954305.1 hypothetical protein [Mesorhizobium sp. BR1-1-15]TPJ61256.1 hypothetical protein FJ443_18230 [Mesorhizobium sp. B2-6-1]